VTNTKVGQLAFLEARHRAHARVEDRIRHAKDTGLGRLPSREFAINQTWLMLTQIAAGLTTWTRLLALIGDAEAFAACEPKALPTGCSMCPPDWSGGNADDTGGSPSPGPGRPRSSRSSPTSPRPLNPSERPTHSQPEKPGDPQTGSASRRRGVPVEPPDPITAEQPPRHHPYRPHERPGLTTDIRLRVEGTDRSASGGFANPFSPRRSPGGDCGSPPRRFCSGPVLLDVPESRVMARAPWHPTATLDIVRNAWHS
jgi:hypothetical protein